jgi:hypothetical protein
MKTVLAAVALAAVAAAPANARIAPAVVAAADVDRLVALLLPNEAMLKLVARAFDQGIEQESAKDPQLMAAFQKYPGLRAYIVAEVGTELARVMTAQMPALRQEIRGVILGGMTPSEIADTLTFFASPTGEKLRTQVYDTVANQPGSDTAQMQAAAMSALMASLKPEDYPALMAFGASPASRKMQALNPRISAVSMAWSSRARSWSRQHSHRPRRCLRRLRRPSRAPVLPRPRPKHWQRPDRSRPDCSRRASTSRSCLRRWT